jgi:hypothetical protein
VVEKGREAGAAFFSGPFAFSLGWDGADGGDSGGREERKKAQQKGKRDEVDRIGGWAWGE